MENKRLPAFKRRALESRKARLIEEYEAIMAQLDQTLSAADEVKLKRQAQARETEIDEIDAQLAGSAVATTTAQPAQAYQPVRAHQPVRGIPTELSLPLKDTLLQCAPYLSAPVLQTVLAHEMLTPWRYSVPVVPMLKSQVDMIISQLADQYHVNGQNALVIFLQVLADNYDEADHMRGALLDLATQLATFK